MRLPAELWCLYPVESSMSSIRPMMPSTNTRSTMNHTPPTILSFVAKVSQTFPDESSSDTEKHPCDYWQLWLILLLNVSFKAHDISSTHHRMCYDPTVSSFQELGCGIFWIVSLDVISNHCLACLNRSIWLYKQAWTLS